MKLLFFFRLRVIFLLFFFFFSSRRRHTRLVSDWSSDVCSSDLLACVLSWEQPAAAMHHPLPPPNLPPLTQQGQQIGREHGVAILPTLAALDPEQHARAVDI